VLGRFTSQASREYGSQYLDRVNSMYGAFKPKISIVTQEKRMGNYWPSSLKKGLLGANSNLNALKLIVTTKTFRNTKTSGDRTQWLKIGVLV